MSENEAAAAIAAKDTTPEQEETALGAAGLPTGAEVSAGPPPAETSDETEFAIGDWVSIVWGAGSQKTVGTIYYLSDSLMRIMPESASNILVDFPIENGAFAPEIGIVEDEFEYEEGPRTTFVELNGLAVGQMVDAYTSTGGLPVATFEVVSVNADDDKVKLRDAQGREQDYAFDNRGIDTSEPFAILRVQPQHMPAAPLSEEEMAFTNSAETLQSIDGADDPLLALLAEGGDLEVHEIGEWQTEQFERAETIAPKQRVYSEFEQKDDMRSDLIGMLDAASQQNPLNRKRIRALVEMMGALKQGTVEYKYDGTYIGHAKVSLSTLNDVLHNKHVPLARPVLETKRVIVTERSPPDDSVEGITIRTVENLAKESKQFLERHDTLPVPEEGVGIPRFYQMMQNYFSQFPMGDEYSREGYKFQQDAEYFRKQPPGAEGIPGLASGTDEKGELEDSRYDGENPADYIEDIRQSLRRAHGPTYFALPKGGTDRAIAADSAPVNGYVMFPYSTVETGVVGSTRTGALWQDILRSFTTQKSWMSELIEELGGIVEEADAKKAIYIKSTDKTLYEVPFVEYLKLVLRSVIPYGPGDLFAMKRDLGIENSEPDVAQSEIIEDRVKEVIAGLIKTVVELRKQLEARKIEPTINPVLDAAVGKQFADAVFAVPFLADIVQKMGQRTPGYKGVDVAIMGSFLVYAQDFAMAALSGNEVAKTRERLKANMNVFLQTLADARSYRILQETRGAPPELNPCAHVQTLDLIRRIQDDTLRMKALVKFLKAYRGGRTDNWVQCNFCKHNLICQHEVMQIQQFLNPINHLAIQKEIVLNYAGGTFGANHICKNCGLRIAELGYDTTIEYGDDGLPKSGRAVLVDEEARALEAISDLFDLPAEEQDEIRFESTVKNEFYSILKALNIRFGIEMNMKTIRRLVERADPKMNLIISEGVYEGTRKKGEGKPRYGIYKAYVQVGIMSALFLLEIQSRIPPYMPRLWLEGCKPGFGGYPLQPDSSPDTPEQAIGLEYILCGILGIQKQEFPWNDIAAIRKGDERKAYLKYHIKEQILEELKNAEVQADLNKKREFLRELYGGTSVSGKHSEAIPANFLPHVETEFEASKAAARAPTISEGAYGVYGETVMADTWIRAANRLAKETTVYIENTPFIETGCCYSPISRPGLYFSEAVLPPLPKRRYLAPGFYRQSILYTPMNPRPLVMFDVEPDMSVAFRVFLKVCWRGERIGLAHEFGYDNKCDWCGTEIPSKFLRPDLDKNGEPIIDETKLSTELERQGVPLTREGFQQLLDATNSRQIFKSYKVRKPFSGTKILEGLANVEPAPGLPTDEEDASERWQDAITTIVGNIRGLREDASDVEVSAAIAPLRDMIEDAEEKLEPILSKTTKSNISLKKLLLDILLESPDTVIDIIRTYFLVSAKRISKKMLPAFLHFFPRRFKLEDKHLKQMNDLVDEHLSYMVKYYPMQQKGHRKMRYFVDTLGAALHAVEELRVSRLNVGKLSLSGKKVVVNEILRAILLGSLGQLADAEFDVEALEGVTDEGGEDVVDVTPTKDDVMLKNFIADMILKYHKERTVYNPAQVREELAKAKELEKNVFIGILDKIQDPEEKRTELIFKRLKMKTSRHNWNLGATALSYDDVWLENQKVIGKMYAAAAEMGQGLPGEIPEGFELDETGYGYGDEGMGPEDDGYDMNEGQDRDDEH